MHSVFPPAKKFRAPLQDGEGDFFFPVTGFPKSAMGHMGQSLLNCNTFPAGMQGARQNLFSKPSFSNFLSQNDMCNDNSFGNNMVPKFKTVSTELNIGGSQSENLSPDSQSSIPSFGTEFNGIHCCSSAKVGAGCIQLFGTIIHMKQRLEGGFDEVGTEDDGVKGYSETQGIDSTLLIKKRNRQDTESCFSPESS